MAEPFYRGTDAELASGAENLVAVVTPSPGSWGLSSAIVAEYGVLSASYSAALTVSTTPSTRTTVTVSAKRTARKNLVAASINVARIIAATPTVTNPQLLSLQLNERRSPQPRPAPQSPPRIQVTAVEGRRVSLQLRDQTSLKRGKPFGAASAQLFSFVGPDAPSGERAYHFAASTTRPKTQIQFPDSVASGATVWLSARWVNARGETSPSSAPISFTMQGGPAVPEAA